MHVLGTYTYLYFIDSLRPLDGPQDKLYHSDDDHVVDLSVLVLTYKHSTRYWLFEVDQRGHVLFKLIKLGFHALNTQVIIKCLRFYKLVFARLALFCNLDTHQNMGDL